MASRTVALVLLGVDRLSPALKKAEKGLDRFQKRLSAGLKVPALTSSLTALSGAASTATAAILPLANAIVGLPGAFAASKAAMGTLQVGLYGVGDAMEAVAEDDAEDLAEALEKLSPEARRFVLAFQKIKTDALDPIREATQDALFQGLNKELVRASSNLAPAVKSGMTSVAQSMNAAAKEAAAFGQTSLARGTVTKVFVTTAKSVRTLTGAIQPAGKAVAQLVQLGLPLTEQLATWAANGVKAAAAWVTSAEGMATLQRMVESGRDALASWGRILGNILVGVVSMFGQTQAGGRQFLATLEDLTTRFREWAQSAEGQRQTAEAIRLLTTSTQTLASVLPVLMGPLGAFAHLMVSLPPGTREVVTQLLAFTIAAQKLNGPLIALGLGLSRVASTAALMGVGLVKGAAGLGQNASAAARAGAAIRTVAVAFISGVASAGKLTASLAAQALAWARNAAQAGLSAARTLAAATAQRVAAVATRGLAAAQTLLNAAMRANPVALVITVLVALGAALVTAYRRSETFRKIVTGAWSAIRSATTAAWNGVIRPVLSAFATFLSSTLGPRVQWLYRTVVKPVWSSIGSTIRSVWTGTIRPVFQSLASFITKTVPSAFKTGVSAIGRFWNQVRDIAKRPVSFIVNTVYNAGIRRVWNWVASKVNLPQLPPVKGFATGGRITQGTTSKADDVLIRASRGEFIVNAAATRRNLDLLQYVNQHGRNKDVLKELGLAGDPGRVIPGFAGGGLIGWVKRFGQAAKDWFADGLVKAARAVLDPMRSLVHRTIGGTPWGAMLAAAVDRLADALLRRFEPLESQMGGPGRRAVQAARKQIGVPYSWGGGGLHGPTRGIGRGAGTVGFDCSGLVRYAWYQATGNVMPRTTYAMWPWLTKISGPPREGDLGFPHLGHVFMYSGKGKIIEAPYTGARVREVPVRPARWGRPPAWFMRSRRMDSGGILRPGLNPPIYNGTGAAEYVLTGRQLQAAGGIQIQELHVHVPYGADEVAAGRAILRAIQAAVRRDGKSALKVILP